MAENNYQIQSISHRGKMHKNNNEDFILSEKKEVFLLNAVFDGCSTGKDSHFASAFLAKILRKVFRNFIFSTQQSEEETLYNIVKQWIKDINTARELLHIPIDELLSTAIVSLLNTHNKSAQILVIGDGFVSLNSENHSIEQENRPNYLAYHLDDLKKEANFENWYKNENLQFQLKNTEKLCIATDGIFSFRNQQNPMNQSALDPLSYLLDDPFLQGNKSMFARKLNILKNKYSLENLDDLSIFLVSLI